MKYKVKVLINGFPMKKIITAMSGKEVIRILSGKYGITKVLSIVRF